MSPENQTDLKTSCLVWFVGASILTGAIFLSSNQENRINLKSFPTPVSSPLPDNFSLRNPQNQSETIDNLSCPTTDTISRQEIERLTASWPPELHPLIPCILESSAKYNLNPSLIAAIIIDRSQGRNKVNPDGSVGYMGVMPSNPPKEYFCQNGPCFEDRPNTEELLDPKTNIEIGSKILREYLDYHQDLFSALDQYGSRSDNISFPENVIELTNYLENLESQVR